MAAIGRSCGPITLPWLSSFLRKGPAMAADSSSNGTEAWRLKNPSSLASRAADPSWLGATEPAYLKGFTTFTPP